MHGDFSNALLMYASSRFNLCVSAISRPCATESTAVLLGTRCIVRSSSAARARLAAAVQLYLQAGLAWYTCTIKSDAGAADSGAADLLV
jgi:hypothetical protein